MPKLGGTSLAKGKRHPTIGNNVVIGSAAILLGPITVVCDANSVVVKSVPDGAVVVGVPGRVVEANRKHIMDLQHGELPDPFSEALRVILEEQSIMREKLAKLERPHEKHTVSEESTKRIKAVEKMFKEGDGI